MKTTKKKLLYGISVIILFFTGHHTQAENTSWYKFNHINALNGLPSNDVQKVYQDRDGYIWIATRNGLSQYNGYSIKTYKSNLYSINLLSSNNITCLVEDLNHRLWIGTNKGLNMLDKTTGKIVQIVRPELFENAVSCILFTKKGKLLLGTDNGLYEYVFSSNTCILYNQNNTGGVLQQTTIKALLEDSRGDLWIGTWNEGLYRYEAETEKYFAYPQMNAVKSSHVIFEDSQKRIWVGSWGYGLYLLDNVYSPAHTTWKIFAHNASQPASISDNLIYSISEDTNNGALWVGTRSGLSILPMNASETFTNFYPQNQKQCISGNEVNSILRDSQGLMWLGMIGSGLSYANTHKPTFDVDRLEMVYEKFASNSVRSILAESDEEVWLGIGSYGLFIENCKTGKITHCSEISDFKAFSNMQKTVTQIMKSSSTGKLWISTYGDGIFVYDKTAKIGSRVQNYTSRNTDWMPSSVIYCAKEDKNGNVWIGSRNGLSALTKEGKGLRFDSLKVDGKIIHDLTITDIIEGKNN
ncbi:MAG: hybrid sensor histidine kinase/response regulator, partial [Candidatus Symbiothrix sp.]|nr:hybrid sensor histidine kinase/response regulator [Candidatus Symbiothrix sp.]